MAYIDNGRSASFGAITIYRATSALTDAAARVERWLGGRKSGDLRDLSPAELEDIGLSVVDLPEPRRRVFAELFEALRAWQARRLTVKALARLSDAQLDDIGLTRYDVEAIRSGQITV